MKLLIPPYTLSNAEWSPLNLLLKAYGNPLARSPRCLTGGSSCCRLMISTDGYTASVLIRKAVAGAPIGQAARRSRNWIFISFQ